MNGIRRQFNAANNQQRLELFWFVTGLPSHSTWNNLYSWSYWVDWSTPKSITLWVNMWCVWCNWRLEMESSNGSFRAHAFWASKFFGFSLKFFFHCEMASCWSGAGNRSNLIRRFYYDDGKFRYDARNIYYLPADIQTTSIRSCKRKRFCSVSVHDIWVWWLSIAHP